MTPQLAGPDGKPPLHQPGDLIIAMIPQSPKEHLFRWSPAGYWIKVTSEVTMRHYADEELIEPRPAEVANLAHLYPGGKR